MKGLLLVALALIAVASLIYGQSTAGSSYSSNVFRVSPYGRCDADNNAAQNLRTSVYPCLADGQFTFEQYTSKNTTPPAVASLLALQIGGRRIIYIGTAINEVQVVLDPPEATNLTQAVTLQTFDAPAAGVNGNFISTVSDGTTFVAFLNKDGFLVKFGLETDGTIQYDSSVDTGVANANSVIFNSPNLIIGGGTKIGVVNAVTMAVVGTALTVTGTPQPGNIACGAITGDRTQILYSTSNGVIFAYNIASKTVTTSIAAPDTVTFSPACVAKSNTYALFVTNSGMLYQYAIPNATNPTLSAPQYTIQNIGNAGQVPSQCATNPDGTAFYFITYNAGGSTTYFPNIYEFKLYDTTFDFNSITQELIQAIVVFVNPNILSPVVASTGSDQPNSIYIGSNSIVPRLYELRVPSTLSTTIPVNTTLMTSFVPDYSIPRNPTGTAGNLNNIGSTVGTSNLLIANGIGVYNFNNSLSTTVSPARGPITTYLRGTQSVSPASGGSPNINAGLALRLVTLDEVSSPATSGSDPTLIRSLPFFSPNDVPWFKQDNTVAGQATTSNQWFLGVTNTQFASANQYAYPLVPNAKIVNNTVPRAVTSRKRVTPINQFTPGYMSFAVSATSYINDTLTTLGNTPFNISTRMVLYQFSVTNYPFSNAVTSSFLRLSFTLGIGANGTIDANSTTNITGQNNTAPVIPGVMFTTESAIWSMLLPRTALQANTVVNTPMNATYNTTTQVMNVYIPRATAVNGTVSYIFVVKYEYVPTAPPPPDNQDGGGAGLLPLWIVLGVVGGLVIIAIIVAIIVIVVVYKVAGDKIKAWIQESQFDQTENALREDRGPF